MKEIVDVIALKKKIEERLAVERATVAKRLRAIRECRDISQNEAAELCDMSERYYGEIERGNANFTLETRVKLCIGFQITPYELFGDLVIEIADDIV